MVSADPAIERAAGVLPLATVRMLVDLARQCADERSALGRTEPRTDRLGNDTERNNAMASADSAVIQVDLPMGIPASNPLQR
jgi:hypothetical protein